MGSLLNDIRISNDYTPPQDACTTYRLLAALKAFVDLHQHVHLENNILFPKAIGMFKYKQRFQLISPKLHAKNQLKTGITF